MSARTYRGWAVSYDPPPIPVRTCDWSAAHPDYDGEGDSRCLYAGSLADLQGAVDAWHDENDLGGSVSEAEAHAEAGRLGIADPDYARVFTKARCLAWQEGYALLAHGTKTRDLDLLAVPWAERACEPEHLIRRIIAATGLRSATDEPGVKPHGRLAWTLLFPEFGDPRFVDIGVMSQAAPPASALARGGV